MARAKYRHMLPAEVVIWDRYLAGYSLPEGEVNYDLHLGDGAAVQEGWPEWMGRVVASLSRHRADCVVVGRNLVTIFEVKEIAGMGAVGQLLGYEALYLRDYGVDRPVRLVCVCARMEADIEAVFNFYEIEAVVV